MGNLSYNKPWILQRADPYVLKHQDGKYYFTASVPAYDRIILRCSDTLMGLAKAEEKTIWTKHDNGPMSKYIWAPELHYLQGKWYIYFAAGMQEDEWAIRPYVLECQGENPLEDEWVEKGKMQAADGDVFSFNAFSLDATVFEHKGKYYFIWAEKVSVGPQISNLYIAEMESPYKLKTKQVLLTTPDYDWERVGFWVNEGPFILKHNGKIFLTFSASDTSSAYCIGMLTANESDDLLDPRSWHKERNPVVKTNEEKGIYGPGHNCFTVSEEGKDIMIYHARTKKEITGNPLHEPNRHTMIMPIEWNQDGSPKFCNEIE
ncbi:MAG: glycoside hydrolase family 43 protein [Cellulosilyticum sp.]|nr:glycoside hydrolase family 43 protein [Cellulosilyticum sp.]